MRRSVDPHVPEVYAKFACAMGALTGSLVTALCHRDWVVVATFAVLVGWVGREVFFYRRSL